ncbi:MAG TPA: hypothetical protein VF668_21770 [Pyrinomonadaceae bacterium]|jgi:hypothetical protein
MKRFLRFEPATCSNLCGSKVCTLRTFDLLASRGRTVRVYLLGREDGALQTPFAPDDTAPGGSQ